MTPQTPQKAPRPLARLQVMKMLRRGLDISETTLTLASVGLLLDGHPDSLTVVGLTGAVRLLKLLVDASGDGW
ncbi:hypothetical protein DEIPH_ctg054orf0007 [Deinococcus phoenicis]|uniref:Uncharacterized protein n=1 Tax=Deinococcus phoenicis TaxID=1476583 RepID=A0A016QML6_9DEIO|nr:hypothetical protein [Deinococcus phoenicis]EYB67004.1 hypothetical protein DEIPH_ctg054orf0007 [Deinococcus phoenicis]